jgi:hypothetical protein
MINGKTPFKDMRLNLSKLTLGEPSSEHHHYTDDSPRASSVISTCETHITDDYESLAREGDSVQVSRLIIKASANTCM